MAFVVLLSTMSFTIDMHFCGDTLVDTAVFKKASDCGMKMNMTSSSDCSKMKKNCCTEKQISVDGQDELNLAMHQLSLEQQQFIICSIYSYLSLFEAENENIFTDLEYKPPLIVRQVYKLDESYLI